MKKKYLGFALFAILFLRPIQIPAQNWFPLEVGNEWQYLIYEEEEFPPGYLSRKNLLKNFSITSDTIISNKSYYKWSLYGNNWFRFDESQQKIFIYCNDSDVVWMDFSQPVDSLANLWTTSCYEKQMHIREMNYFFGDSLIYGKGFMDYYPGINESYYPDYFSVNLGLTLKEWWSYYHGGGYGSSEYLLINARISNTQHSNPFFPEFIITPIVAVCDSLFELIFEVNHKYNRIYLDSLPHTSLYFIDTVYMHSYYSKDSIILENPVIFGEIISGSEMWEINTTLNMDLMRADYNFNYKIEAVDKGLFPHRSFSPGAGYYVVVYDTTTDVRDYGSSIVQYELHQNYPNPFNPTTRIKYQIPELSYVIIKVYNVLGKEVATLLHKEKNGGNYQIIFDGSYLPSGVYFYKLHAGDFIQTKKMILLK